MSDTQLHDSVTPAPSTATPGELLSRQRESLGVPLADAARALNLRPASRAAGYQPAANGSSSWQQQTRDQLIKTVTAVGE